MIKRILYATDLGLYSPYVMKSLARLASSTDAQIYVLHVIEPLGVFAESILKSYISENDRRHLHQYGLEKVLTGIKQQVTDALEVDYRDMLRGIEVVSVDVELGSPAQLIMEQAVNIQADIILMGSRGQYSLESTALGSTTNKVLQGSSVPVMVIPMMGLDDLDRRT